MWLVELAAVQEPALVPAAVAVALEVHQPPGMSLVEALAGVLARQQLLLMLDNCEHMLAAVAELCGTLLTAADDVRVLATSREPVGIAGEARFRLPPLAVPGPDHLADAGASDAVVLFADRARQLDSAFALTGDSRRWWHRSWGGWMGCRWRSSWPRPGPRRWVSRSCWSGWITGLPC